MGNMFDFAELSKHYEVRKLEVADVDDILSLCVKNELYYQYCPPLASEETIFSDMKSLPQGKTYDDKHYVGYYDKQRLIAVMDLIEGYPDEKTAFIGFFMVEAEMQNQGIGSSIIDELCYCLIDKGFQSVQLGWIKGNQQAERFWKKCGFCETGISIDSEGRKIVKAERKLFFENAWFINGTAYAGKSTMVRLLAEKHDGILCKENYHDVLEKELDAGQFPNLTYTRDLDDWHKFIRRSPEEYKRWIDDVSKECEILELRLLSAYCAEGRKVFVDTNISPETLRKITPHDHVLIMLADPQISVNLFFEREDKEKQFLYRLLMEEEDPQKALDNYRRGLELINSKESYECLLNSGFNVILRDGNRSIEQTLSIVEEKMGFGE